MTLVWNYNRLIESPDDYSGIIHTIGELQSEYGWSRLGQPDFSEGRGYIRLYKWGLGVSISWEKGSYLNEENHLFHAWNFKIVVKLDEAEHRDRNDALTRIIADAYKRANPSDALIEIAIRSDNVMGVEEEESPEEEEIGEFDEKNWIGEYREWYETTLEEKRRERLERCEGCKYLQEPDECTYEGEGCIKDPVPPPDPQDVEKAFRKALRRKKKRNPRLEVKS